MHFNTLLSTLSSHFTTLSPWKKKFFAERVYVCLKKLHRNWEHQFPLSIFRRNRSFYNQEPGLSNVARLWLILGLRSARPLQLRLIQIISNKQRYQYLIFSMRYLKCVQCVNAMCVCHVCVHASWSIRGLHRAPCEYMYVHVPTCLAIDA